MATELELCKSQVDRVIATHAIPGKGLVVSVNQAIMSAMLDTMVTWQIEIQFPRVTGIFNRDFRCSASAWLECLDEFTIAMMRVAPEYKKAASDARAAMVAEIREQREMEKSIAEGRAVFEDINRQCEELEAKISLPPTPRGSAP